MWSLSRSALRTAAVLLALLASACAGKSPRVTPSVPAAFTERGQASWYGGKFHGRPTASGERFDMHALTAAHRTLPFGALVEVENLENGRRVRVRINDRGPFVSGRVIDLSRAAARELDMIERGVVPVLVVRLR